jgi:hypothetical protein
MTAHNDAQLFHANFTHDEYILSVVPGGVIRPVLTVQRRVRLKWLGLVNRVDFRITAFGKSGNSNC